MRVSVTLFFVRSQLCVFIRLVYIKVWFIILSDLFRFFFCLGGMYVGLGDLVFFCCCCFLYVHCSLRVVLLRSCVTSVSLFILPGSPYICPRAPRWPLSCSL